MWIGPPNALDMPKPMSSISTINTFGAPSGALISKRGGGVALRASSSVIGGYAGALIGSTVRSTMAACGVAAGAAGSGLALHPDAPTANVTNRPASTLRM